MRTNALILGSQLLIVWACAEIQADIILKNDSDRAANVWYRKNGASGWGQPVSIAAGETKSLPIPTLPPGTYRFCYMLPNRDYVYMPYSRLEPGQTYTLATNWAGCGGDKNDHLVDLETVPCHLTILRVAGPEPERPDGDVKIGIVAHKCDEGIHVDSVESGMPAAKCFDRETGENVMLEPGDHILFVNGRRPNSIGEFQRLISESSRSIELKVLDSRSGKRRHLTTELW